MLTTILLILLIPLAAIAFICAAVTTCGKAFVWMFKILYEVGKLAFILFLAWVILSCVMR